MTTLTHHRPALLAQITRRKVEGLGVVAGHPPTSAGWREIPNGSAYLALALRDGAYRGAYSQSREVPMVGVGGMRILWKSWQHKGLGYAQSRMPSGAMSTVYRFSAAAAGAEGASSLSGLESRLRPYMDDAGTLDVGRFGIGNPGLADFILGLGPNPASSPDWSRWAAMPVKPPVNDPRWAPLTTADLEHMQRQQGWAAAVATAQQSGDPRFQFRRKWYEVSTDGGYKVLTGGMGVRTSDIIKAVAGTPGVGATNPNFFIAPGVDANTAMQSTLDAVNALLVGYSANGVPSEHVASPLATAVQVAWNREPKVIAAGVNAKLAEDTSYGPNTALVVATLNGGSAPAVNTGSTTPVPTTVVVNNTSTTTAPSNWTTPLLIGAALVAAAGITTAAVMHTKKRRARRAAHHTTHHHAYA